MPFQDNNTSFRKIARSTRTKRMYCEDQWIFSERQIGVTVLQCEDGIKLYEDAKTVNNFKQRSDSSIDCSGGGCCTQRVVLQQCGRGTKAPAASLILNDDEL